MAFHHWSNSCRILVDMKADHGSAARDDHHEFISVPFSSGTTLAAWATRFVDDLHDSPGAGTLDLEFILNVLMDISKQAIVEPTAYHRIICSSPVRLAASQQNLIDGTSFKGMPVWNDDATLVFAPLKMTPSLDQNARPSGRPVDIIGLFCLAFCPESLVTHVICSG